MIFICDIFICLRILKSFDLMMVFFQNRFCLTNSLSFHFKLQIIPIYHLIEAMKIFTLISLLLSNISVVASQVTCCEVDRTKPNVSNMQPSNKYTANVNEWITFKAEVNDACGIASVSINIQGYALSGHETRETVGCPAGHFCRDYRFPAMGENSWTVEAVDNCGLRRITGAAYFCVGSCPRYLRSLAEAISDKGFEKEFSNLS